MKINFRRGLLGALLLLLTACSYKTADSSCVADDPNTMNPCTGCPSVSGEDTSLRCLADNGDGEIYVDYDACRHSDFTFTDEFACSGRAVLVAHAYGSKPAKKLIPYGVDAIKKFPADSDFYVFATNRENDRVIGFDEVDRVSLGAGYAEIVPFIQEKGYGGLSRSLNEWFVIPDAKFSDLHVITLDVLGQKTDDYAFGAALEKADPKLAFITDFEILNNGDIVLSFAKGGLTEGKGGPFEHIVVSPSEKKFYTLQQR